jgi:competence protein ComEC
VVRLLDVGQGDATLITNGTNVALVDGGPDMDDLGDHLDRLGLGRDRAIDVVVLSHQHADHYMGLRELFRSSRRLRVRYFFENRDVSPNSTLKTLRDSVLARAHRGELTYRDSDDPCGDGRAVCTITLNGGAKLQILRPDPDGPGANNRSTPVKLVGPDSASFTMWLAGDAEHQAIAWYNTAGYGARPGMRAHVLKADHHGSCNGVTTTYLARVRPSWLVVSLGARNTYGHMHEQAKAMYRAAGVPWYRTDRNGTITIRTPGTPGGGFTITPERPGESLDGQGDRRSTAEECGGR